MNGAGYAAPEIAVRDASSGDFASIAAIYSRHVRCGTASFEIQPPDVGTLVERWRAVTADGLPYLAAEIDGAVVGFAYATLYRPRRAYRFTVEHSIYVRYGDARKGIGHRLIEVLVERCAALGYRQMIAVIGDSNNEASIGFHRRHGFRHAGTLPSVGYKFDRWVDSVLMIRPLGDGNRSAPSGRM